MIEKSMAGLEIDFVYKLFGTLDNNIILLENGFQVRIQCKGDCLVVSGDNEENVTRACSAIEQLQSVTRLNDSVDENSINYVIGMVNEGRTEELSGLYADCICLTGKGKPVKARTVGQKKYVEAIKSNTVVFGVGPAGTGKTFLAVAMAVTALKHKEITRIILTRPAVEAGEKLGFLPGDLQSKIDPYLRPLYDALGEMLGHDSFRAFIEKGTIEIAPLAYMRGRTLDDAFVILDEAQNSTPEQMKMFLTRLGSNSKAIVTGDITQIDLPELKKSGLVEAIRILDNIPGISIFRFSHRDVVRHPLVQKIILAYESFEKSNKNNTEQRAHSPSAYRRRPNEKQ
ncbi:MAG TPA: PhoH family protein [Bacillota bacterium]|nr:PhoH family protein [Bacillota bacterium]